MGKTWPMLGRAAFWPAILACAVWVSFLYISDLWAALVAWHFYLDRLHPIFLSATSFAARAAMGAMAAAWVLLFFTFLALLFARPRASYLAVEDSASGRRWGLSLVDNDVLDELSAAHLARNAPPAESLSVAPENDADPAPDWDVPLRNRWDQHPDDKPRAPISAQRELPAGGLTAMRSEASAAPITAAEWADARGISGDKPNGPPSSTASADEPWLQPVERSGPPDPAAHDVSLSALVQRLEARLARRRRAAGPPEMAAPPIVDLPVPETPPMTVSDHSVDLALEAALGTLQRMNLRAVG